MSNKSHLELIGQRRANQATTKACVGEIAPKPLWNFALCKLTAGTICYVMVATVVAVNGSVDGGRHEKMFGCWSLTVDCNRTKKMLKRFITSLYCTRLK
jgi:hypothetical protein